MMADASENKKVTMMVRPIEQMMVILNFNEGILEGDRDFDGTLEGS